MNAPRLLRVRSIHWLLTLLALCATGGGRAFAAVNTWSQIATSGTGPHFGRPWIVLDAPGARMYVVDDSVITSLTPPSLPPDVLWSISLTTGAWGPALSDTQYAGGEFNGHYSSQLRPELDAAHHRLINLMVNPSSNLNRMRLWNLDGPPGWGWTPLSGSDPRARFHPGVVADPGHDRIWFSGGVRYVCMTCGAQGFSDLWSLELGADHWTNYFADATDCALSPDGPLYLDETGDRLLTMGGRFLSNDYFFGSCNPPNIRSVWAMPLHAPYGWTQIGAAPPAVETSVFAFDAHRRRLLAFDRSTGDVRELRFPSGTSWDLLTTVGTRPPVRLNGQIAYDPISDRLLLFGGITASRVVLNDVWQLSFLGATPVEVSLVEASAESGIAHVVWDVDGLESKVIDVERRDGGVEWREVAASTPDGSGRLTFVDTDLSPGIHSYRLKWEEDGSTHTAGEVEVDVPAAPALSIRALPFADGLSVVVVLPDDRPARLDCYDLSGRRMARRELNLGPGSHRLRLEGSMGSGIWWVRVEQGGRQRTANVVLLR